ncbi:RecT-like ssDNA annealing protein [Gordonia phage Frokostdame]|uniref:RecT-like ssDNA binding protein n=1 Tax=Gordonia phage Frokostdame TaxID=2250320 RepID=A0A345L349_9CAUD|nr:RecT-like ssDNA annealing protein [Gordonia phage Frokostdame]AXH49701.1 RecT-like ssDNA binding protein [Gordonia phage Frokostdame]
MTNDLAQQDSPFGGGNVTPFGRQPAAPTLARTSAFERLSKWSDLFMQCAKAAEHLSRTEFVPDAFRNKPESVAAAMLKGAELGIDPLDALQNIYVVKGKVGFSAEFMRRRIIEAGHEIVLKESTDTRCVIRGRRKDSEEWQQVTFTADNAKAAGIDIKNYPADKLVARASSRLFRRVFPDVMSGTAIIEDVIDGEQGPIIDAEPTTNAKSVESAPIQRKSSPRKTAAKKAAPAKSEKVNDPGDQPPLPDEDAASDASESRAKPEPEQVKEVGVNSQGQESITPAQLKKLHVVMSKEGLTDRDAALEWLSQQIGRPLETSKDLGKDEASGIIDFLEQAQAEDAAKGRGQ